MVSAEKTNRSAEMVVPHVQDLNSTFMTNFYCKSAASQEVSPQPPIVRESYMSRTERIKRSSAVKKASSTYSKQWKALKLGINISFPTKIQGEVPRHSKIDLTRTLQPRFRYSGSLASSSDRETTTRVDLTQFKLKPKEIEEERSAAEACAAAGFVDTATGGGECRAALAICVLRIFMGGTAHILHNNGTGKEKRYELRWMKQKNYKASTDAFLRLKPKRHQTKK